MTETPIAHSSFAQPNRLYSLELLRGFAALLVVAHHAGRFLLQNRYGGTNILHGILGEMHLGVDFFFVLSGFVIAWVHWNDLGHRDRLKHYALQRFTRIYPVYWAFLIPLAVLYHIFPASGQHEQTGWLNFFVSFVLAPCPQSMIIGVAWTLTYEMFFYLMFGVMILLGERKSMGLLALWVIGIFSCAVSNNDNPALAFILNPYNLEFLFGIAAALLLRRRTLPYAHWFALIGLAVFLGCMVNGAALALIDHPLATRLLFGLSAMTALAGFVVWERAGELAFLSKFRLFGAMSYALYLVHPTAQSLLMLTFWTVFLHELSPTTVCAALILTGIAAGLVFHLLIEKPLTAYVRQKLAS